ncbi:WD repeat-containing protein 36-like isoform X3 [Asparagus officinalis]|uniref:WD repeat-containing protein 36-like isoform X3 n=1 Tax=Asparagus officinalis TaxID=4686 RepID=UPI00098E82E8|nr:WD repeat-containing protein 36-like isoform X3 [Asparagus officinalis]
MEFDSWSRFSAASRRHQLTLQSRFDLYLGFDDVEGGEDDFCVKFGCPFYAEDFDIVGLCCHLDEEHLVEAKNGEEEIKLKLVLNFDVVEIREHDWGNVVTCHMDTPQAYVWRLQNFVLGEHIPTPSTDKQTHVKACTISACGNFAILGTEGGWIERFILQSGISRGSYVDIAKSQSCAHDGEVHGIENKGKDDTVSYCWFCIDL